VVPYLTSISKNAIFQIRIRAKIKKMSEIQTLGQLGKVNLGCECYVIKDGKVLMFKKSETSSRFPGWWIGPGGRIDHNEDALLAGVREIEEEAGVKVDLGDIKLKAIAFHHHLDRGEVWISFIFLATIPEYQTEKGIDIEGQSKWIPLPELLTMDQVFPPTKYYFDHLFNNKPGIMYTNIQWEKAELVKVLSQRVDTNG
jgi:8-oxo-dGTP pyrophosphatase MutT (NUDIX family)